MSEPFPDSAEESGTPSRGRLVELTAAHGPLGAGPPGGGISLNVDPDAAQLNTLLSRCIFMPFGCRS
jgi:hypothetical protein